MRVVGVPLVVAVDFRPPSAHSISATPGYTVVMRVLARGDKCARYSCSISSCVRSGKPEIEEQIVQMPPDVAAQDIRANVRASAGGQDLLHRAADIARESIRVPSTSNT